MGTRPMGVGGMGNNSWQGVVGSQTIFFSGYVTTFVENHSQILLKAKESTLYLVNLLVTSQSYALPATVLGKKIHGGYNSG